MFSNRITQFLAVGTLIAAIFLTTLSLVSPPRPAIAQPSSEGMEQGLAIYYLSERASYSIPNKEVGLEQYHRSERGLNENTQNKSQEAGLAIYFQSEKGLSKYANTKIGLDQYHRSEWGLDAPAPKESRDAGMAIYFESERGFPLRDLSAFNAYQRSEWFGR